MKVRVKTKMNKGMIGAIVSGVVLFVGITILMLMMEKVPAGYVGIVYDMNGGVSEDVLTQGWHVVSPTKKVTLYSIGIEQSFEVPTSDGKGLKVDLTFTYRYDPERVTQLFTRFKGQSGKEVRNSFIKPNIISWVKEVTAKYPVTEILGEERANLNIAVSEYVREKFDPYGIIVENTSLINIDADEETRAQVQRRVNAIQELELAQTEKKTAQVKADQEKEVALTKAQQDKETAIILAEQEKETAAINAEKQKIDAEAKAEATRIKAKAEAEANKVIAESLTPELIENNKINKWDGSVPSVSGGGVPIINLGGEE